MELAFDFLNQLDEEEWAGLFTEKEPFTILSIFSSLPQLDQHFMFRVLFAFPDAARLSLGGAAAGPDADFFGYFTSRSAAEGVLSRLLRFHLARRVDVASASASVSDSVSDSMIELSAAVLAVLRGWTLRTEPYAPWPPAAGAASRAEAELRALADEHRSRLLWGLLATHPWDGISSSHSSSSGSSSSSSSISTRSSQAGSGAAPALRPPGEPLLGLLRGDGLIDGGGALTPRGWRFLFMGAAAQTWTLLLAFARGRRPRRSAPLLHFLFRASRMRPGVAYAAEGVEAELLGTLRAIGLLWAPPGDEGRCFFVTPLLHEERGGGGQGDCRIIVESNFRLYAYTASALHVQLLGVFADIHYVLPNMVAAHLQRQTAARALKLGVTADDILCYLLRHAHPETRRRLPMVPDVVCEQLRLWEKERNRVRFDPGVLLSRFSSEDAYRAWRRRAEAEGALIWAKDVYRQDRVDIKRSALFVTEEFFRNSKKN